jgi:Cu/Ag efflux protein CusF
MKKVAAVISALAILGAASAASAEEESGTIKRIDAEEGKIVLEDGDKFKVDDDVSLDEFEEGEMVTITYEDEGDSEWQTATSVEQKEEE